MASQRECPKCHSRDIASENSTSVCMKCGAVLEESNIVSVVTFRETSDGGSAVNGTFVPETGRRMHYRGRIHGGRESRQVTIDRGRKRIAHLAGPLRLKQRHIEAAQRLFILAVQRNFIQGRKTQNVVAACLYVICRRERTSHLLIDFADALQTNVYELGHTFLRFCRVLKLQLPVVDPSLFIPRFAAKMELGTKTNSVANTAIRIVGQMARDWMQTGRRPSGICGAALLIAARLHGFRRSHKEVVHIVRVCEVTLRKRLLEFAETPASLLTHEEFEAFTVSNQCDPPAFRKQHEKDSPSETDSDIATIDSAVLREVEETLNTAEFRELGASSSSSNLLARQLAMPLKPPCFSSSSSSSVARRRATESEDDLAANISEDAEVDDDAILPEDFGEDDGADMEEHDEDEDEDDADGDGDKEAKVNQRADDEDLLDDDAEELEPMSDSEASKYMFAPEEVETRQKLWEELNKDYLEAQKFKEQSAAANPPKRKRKRERGAQYEAGTARDAAVQMLTSKFSSKINYEALTTIFEEENVADGASRGPSHPFSSAGLHNADVEAEDDEYVSEEEDDDEPVGLSARAQLGRTVHASLDDTYYDESDYDDL
mmetsp:Transcript_29776/g.74887  ORF Transcript_29776/g.74887 Transcript_29776/m.74887 type:complete len:603 (-) Transcript_29776:65-1873(-)|eukprot:CAMPEP_0177685436 /NCGR_PEP_ID=MMETSP0447-20121125/33037_1 /TAXON_ID=0 /ORGANISM="Stygamoeba regulata, Strain BSH-02190019" /LENGTH=602 /DNA_ID=CAMNT_0019195497 /DNA_START=123 /DNA_END=1931 /DNA_ORIENTATION=-